MYIIFKQHHFWSFETMVDLSGLYPRWPPHYVLYRVCTDLGNSCCNDLDDHDVLTDLDDHFVLTQIVVIY